MISTKVQKFNAAVDDVCMYLCVAEEKDDGSVFNSSLQHDLLQIIMPLRQSVVLGQLDLKQVVLRTVHTTSRSAVCTAFPLV